MAGWGYRPPPARTIPSATLPMGTNYPVVEVPNYTVSTWGQAPDLYQQLMTQIQGNIGNNVIRSVGNLGNGYFQVTSDTAPTLRMKGQVPFTYTDTGRGGQSDSKFYTPINAPTNVVTPPTSGPATASGTGGNPTVAPTKGIHTFLYS